MRGAKLSVEYVDRGAAFRITTDSRVYVRDLRAMLHDMAAIVERDLETTEVQTTSTMIPKLEIRVADVPKGAVVTITADRSQEVLREHARQVELLWRRSPCVNAGRA